MGAFLDPNGLNLFYGLIAAKFGSGATAGSLCYAKAQYTGDGKSTTGVNVSISNLQMSDDADDGDYDFVLISGAPKNSNGAESIAFIWNGSGISMYRDYADDILTISMLRKMVIGVENKTGRIKHGTLPSGFTPYDPAFTALQPDYAKAMLRDANTYYTIGLFKFSNSVIDSQ